MAYKREKFTADKSFSCTFRTSGQFTTLQWSENIAKNLTQYKRNDVLLKKQTPRNFDARFTKKCLEAGKNVMIRRKETNIAQKLLWACSE